MSASAPEMVAVLMADLVGSTAMADRVVGQSGPS
jgi:class 3 adenylate cyclase